MDKNNNKYLVGALCVIAGGVVFSTNAQSAIVLHTDSINDFDAADPTASQGGLVTWDGLLDGLTAGTPFPSSGETYSFTYAEPDYILSFDVVVTGVGNQMEIESGDDLRVTGGGFIDPQNYTFELANINFADAPGGFVTTLNSASLTNLEFAAGNGSDDEGFAYVIPGAVTPWVDLNAADPGQPWKSNNNVALDVLNGTPVGDLLFPGTISPQSGALIGGNTFAGGGYRIEAIGFQFAVNIPEPSRAILLMMGGLGMLIRRRR